MKLDYSLIFLGIVIFLTVQRALELLLAKYNERYLISQGGKIIKEVNYVFMVILHMSWLSYHLYIAIFTDLTIDTFLFWGGAILLVAGQLLRISAIRTLGKRWSTRIVVLPDEPVIKAGLFNYFRHPNYIGVAIEIAALPLMVSHIYAMIIFSVLNSIVLYYRIKHEEHALENHCDYFRTFDR